MARGPRVPLIAAVERVGLCPGRGPSGRRPTGRRRGGSGRGGGVVRAGRRAGHRQGKPDGLPAHAGGPRWRPAGESDADVQDDDAGAGGDARLAGRVRVTVAAMESTSTYWKAPFYCLEEVMEVWLLN